MYHSIRASSTAFGSVRRCFTFCPPQQHSAWPSTNAGPEHKQFAAYSPFLEWLETWSCDLSALGILWLVGYCTVGPELGPLGCASKLSCPPSPAPELV
ncbi:hypothetical protein V8C43DRAFT_292053 [Trichoderma afarasin]